MTYLFTCPHCQTQTIVGDEYSGLQGACAVCRGEIEVPNFAGLAPVSEEQPVRLMQRPRVRLALAATVVVVLAACAMYGLVQYGGRTLTSIQLNRQKRADATNLEKIAQALNAYAADYGVYPPPVVNDSRGQPMHSWRVLILPYLGYNDLYNRYDFSRSWDENLDQVNSVPQEYRLARDRGFIGQSGYYLVIGPGTLFPTATQSLGPRDLVDDPSKTILVVEGEGPPGSTKSWLEPSDLDVRNMQFAVGGNAGIEIGGAYEEGAMVATVDERSHFLQRSVPPVTVRALLSPAGGEPLPDDVLD